MKKRWILMAALCCVLYNANAQEVFNTLLDRAAAVVNTAEKSDYNGMINYFYYTELNYMKNMAKASNKAAYKVLDQQAYAMQEFVIDFFRQMADAPDTQRKEVINVFIKASLSNPLFNDKDTETTHSFVNDPEYITPFSLDTDWVTAHKEVKKALKQK